MILKNFMHRMRISIYMRISIITHTPRTFSRAWQSDGAWVTGLQPVKLTSLNLAPSCSFRSMQWRQVNDTKHGQASWKKQLVRSRRCRKGLPQVCMVVIQFHHCPRMGSGEKKPLVALAHTCRRHHAWAMQCTNAMHKWYK
jgi:hypothetical protein